MKLSRAATLVRLYVTFILPLAIPSGAMIVGGSRVHAQTTVHSLRADVTVRRILDTGVAPPPVRLAKDARFGDLYYLNQNGDIYRVNTTNATKALIYTAGNHTAPNARGLAIGPDGTFYIVGNEDRPNTQTRATIVKGVLDSRGQRIWSILAQTADYPKSFTAFDHRLNGIAVSPLGDFIYVNSGSRTDHGEVQSAGGLFPNTREVGLTACILRLPTNGQNIYLPNDRGALKNSGYIFAEGTRNSFDLAFAPNNELLAPENGPDRDMPEELNWLQRGLHYGFPWRIGGADNPQQFPAYDPSTDLLLDPRFPAVRNGYYRNDPTFPPRPAHTLTEPIANSGPDADSYRDPQTGAIKDASALNQTLSTFTTHRSPLGLAFDVTGAMASEFNGSGFMLSWTKGDPAGASVVGPFKDPSEDLVHLALTKPTATSYRVQTMRVVAGFSNPIDAEIVGNRLFVLEYGGGGGLWEITFPAAPNLMQNGSFETTGAGWLSPWRFRNDLGATLSQDGTTRVSGSYSAKVNIPRASSSSWFVQLWQKNRTLTAGKTYTISFWAKSSVPRSVEVTLQQGVSPYTLYFKRPVNLTTSWRQYHLTYTAKTTDTDAAIAWNLAQSTGQVWLDDVWLRTIRLP